MGIKGLTSLLKQNSNSIETTKLYTLSGKKVAIDASVFIYQSLIVNRYNNDYLRNDNNKIISHISGIFYKTINYLSLNITPIYIFDGKPPIEKFNTIHNRNIKAKKAKYLMDNSTDIKEKQKFEKQTIRLTPEYINDIKKLLNLMGVAYIHMDGEAEAIASELCRIGYVDYVVTEDMDTLTFGCPKMIRNCIDKEIKSTDSISIFKLDQLLHDLNIDYNQFIELCILCGCDYCDNIPRIGNRTAFKIIKKYNSISNYLKTNPKNIPEDYEQKYLKSIELFKMYHNNINISDLNIYNSELNISELLQFLIRDCCLSDNRVKNAIKKIQIKFMNKN